MTFTKKFPNKENHKKITAGEVRDVIKTINLPKHCGFLTRKVEEEG